MLILGLWRFANVFHTKQSYFEFAKVSALV